MNNVLEAGHVGRRPATPNVVTHAFGKLVVVDKVYMILEVFSS